jgi:hypothetical protein
MVDSRLEGRIRWPVLSQGALVGLGVGVLAMVGAGMFAFDAQEPLVAAAAVSVTLVAAAAVGMWAGAPGASAADPRARPRWFAAGLTTGLAGIFATFWDVATALHQITLVESLALLILVAAPMYALGLLLPSLLAWAEQWEATQPEDEGETDAWEPLGTLALAVLGGITVGIGLTGPVLYPYLGAGPVLLGTAAALILPTLLPEPTQPETAERLLFEAESPLSTIRVVEIVYPGQRQPERRLYVNGEEESGELVRTGAPTLPYIAAAEQWFAATARRGDRYLFLGGGAYTLPRRVAERDAQARITVVELDPEVTRVAHQFFGMRRQLGIQVVHGDARAWIDRADGAAAGGAGFEQIYVDVYAGQEALPYSLVTWEAFRQLARLLTPGGMLTLNAIGVTAGPGQRRFWSLLRTVAEVFPSTALFTHLGRDYPERQNLLLAAVAEPDHTFPNHAGFFEHWPLEEWPDLSDTVVFRDVFPEMTPPRAQQAEAARRAAGE